MIVAKIFMPFESYLFSKKEGIVEASIRRVIREVGFARTSHAKSVPKTPLAMPIHIEEMPNFAPILPA